MEGVQLIFGIIPVAIILLYIFFSSFRILREYERGVIFRFGRRTNNNESDRQYHCRIIYRVRIDCHGSGIAAFR